jgi:hypothetical protein
MAFICLTPHQKRCEHLRIRLLVMTLELSVLGKSPDVHNHRREESPIPYSIPSN